MKDFFLSLGAWFGAFSDPYFAKSTFFNFLSGIGDYFVRLYPYVILGSLIGEALKFTSWTKLIYRFTSQNRVVAVLTATVLGILSPLCTFGTVPVLLSLYAGGVPIAPLISFLAASSMMNPQLFAMTVGGLGWQMALWRLLCVFLFALLCGVFTFLLPDRFVVRKKLLLNECDPDAILNRQKPPFTVKAYLLAFVKNLWFVSKMMLLGIGIAAFVDLLPLGMLFQAVNTDSVGGVMLSALAGIPIYACGGGTIPLISSLMEQGLSRGGALAFLTVGPATRITSLAAVATIFRKRFLVLYVAVLLLFSVVAGLLL